MDYRPKKYFEDFNEGDIFHLGPRTLTRDEILIFAEKFDPQPMHLDDEAAKNSLLGGLSASGWHTTSIMMRLIFDAMLKDSSSISAPIIKDLNWLLPVRPDDTLTGLTKITGTRLSTSKPGVGILFVEHYLENQHDHKVCEFNNPLFMLTRKWKVEN